MNCENRRQKRRYYLSYNPVDLMNAGKVTRTQMEKFIWVWNIYYGLSLQRNNTIPKQMEGMEWRHQNFSVENDPILSTELKTLGDVKKLCRSLFTIEEGTCHYGRHPKGKTSLPLTFWVSVP